MQQSPFVFAFNDQVNASRTFGLNASCYTSCNWKSNQSLRVGLRVYGSSKNIVRTVEVPVAAASYVQRPDSVSADEHARRRRWERDDIHAHETLKATREKNRC